jgi:hypothetical protein
MRDFGKVATAFWSSPTVKASCKDARQLALYMDTGARLPLAIVRRPIFLPHPTSAAHALRFEG